MKYRKTGSEQKNTSLAKAVKKVNWKLVGQLALSFVIFFTIYQIAVYFEFAYIIHIYGGLLTVLACVYVLLNRGLSRESPTPDMLNDEWDDAKKAAYIEDDRARKKKAKKLLLLILPIMFTFIIDLLSIYFAGMKI